MAESAREGLLVDGAGAPIAEEDSGSVELLDGTSIPYHAIAPENASALQRFHHRLSERSIYLRFFAAKPELSDRKAGYFTNVDGMHRFALVALDPERPQEIIAVVSFDREGDTDRAEYAAAVEDRWEGAWHSFDPPPYRGGVEERHQRIRQYRESSPRRRRGPGPARRGPRDVCRFGRQGGSSRHACPRGWCSHATPRRARSCQRTA